MIHQGLLRDGFHRRPQEIRRADTDHSWRRRPDCADRRRGSPLSQASQERNPKDLQGRTARTRVHSPRSAQRRLAGIPQGLKLSIVQLGLLTTLYALVVLISKDSIYDSRPKSRVWSAR